MKIYENTMKMSSYGSAFVASEEFVTEKMVQDAFNQLWPNNQAVRTKCAGLVVNFVKHKNGLCKSNDLENYYFGLHAILSQINKIEMRGGTSGSLNMLFMALMEAAVGTGVYLGENDELIKLRILGSLASEIGNEYSGLQESGSAAERLMECIVSAAGMAGDSPSCTPGEAFSRVVRILKNINRGDRTTSTYGEFIESVRCYLDAAETTFPFERKEGLPRLIDGLLAQVGIAGSSEN